MFLKDIQPPIMVEASTVGLHFYKLRERSSKSLPLAFYVSFLQQHNPTILSSDNSALWERNSKRNLVIYCTAQPERQPLPSEPKKDPWWRNWTLGALLSVGLPLVTNNLGSLVKIRSEFTTKLQTTEDIVEEVERGAREIEKRAERRLEEGIKEAAGIPRRVVLYIESVAETIAKNAHSIDYIIDSIQDIFLLESPDNDQTSKLYSDEKDKKEKEKAMKIEKEETDLKETAMEVDKEKEDRTEKAMGDDKEVKDRKEKAIEEQIKDK